MPKLGLSRVMVDHESVMPARGFAGNRDGDRPPSRTAAADGGATARGGGRRAAVLRNGTPVVARPRPRGWEYRALTFRERALNNSEFTRMLDIRLLQADPISQLVFQIFGKLVDQAMERFEN